MRKFYSVAIAVLAMMLLGMPLKAQFVLTGDANASPFVPAEGKWYRIATPGNKDSWVDPLKYIYGSGTVVKLSSITTEQVASGTTVGLEYYWAFEANPTVSGTYYIKNVGLGIYMNNNGSLATVSLGAKVDAIYNTIEVALLQKHTADAITQSYETYKGYLIKAGGNRTLQPWGDYRWNNTTGGLDRSDCYMFLEAVDASTDSQAKLDLKSSISVAKVVQAATYPINAATSAANATLATAITTAEGVLANAASDDAAYTDATTALNAAVEAYKLAIKPWTDLDTKIKVVENKIAFITPATGGTAFLNYTQVSLDALSAANATAKPFLENGNSTETEAALAALTNAFDAFLATRRVAPESGKFFAVYSWGVQNGDGESTNKKYMQLDADGVTVNAVLSSVANEVAFNDNMLWSISEVGVSGYSLQNKATGTYLSVTTSLSLVADAVELVLRDGTPQAGTTIKKGYDNNFCYFIPGTAERSPQIGATNTSVTPNTVALLMNGIADRMRYQWSFAPAELASVTVKYLDADNIVLKAERVVTNLMVGNNFTASQADKATIDLAGQLYEYDATSTLSDQVVVASGNTSEVVLKFKKAVPTSINKPAAKIALDKKFFSVTGVEIEANTIGTVIEKTIYSDGTIEIKKIVNNRR